MSDVCRNVRVPTSLRNEPTPLSARVGPLVALDASANSCRSDSGGCRTPPDARGDAAHVVAACTCPEVGVAPWRARRLVADARRAVERGDGHVRCPHLAPRRAAGAHSVAPSERAIASRRREGAIMGPPARHGRGRGSARIIRLPYKRPPDAPLSDECRDHRPPEQRARRSTTRLRRRQPGGLGQPRAGDDDSGHDCRFHPDPAHRIEPPGRIALSINVRGRTCSRTAASRNGRMSLPPRRTEVVRSTQPISSTLPMQRNDRRIFRGLVGSVPPGSRGEARGPPACTRTSRGYGEKPRGRRYAASDSRRSPVRRLVAVRGWRGLGVALRSSTARSGAIRTERPRGGEITDGARAANARGLRSTM